MSPGRLWLIPVIIGAAAIMALTATTVHAQQVTFKIAITGSWPYAPGMPIWNPYAPSNIMTTVGIPNVLRLAILDYSTGRLYPVLAENWTVQTLPNGSALLTIYLRKGLYWFNGTATMPFTAWDLYAYFYIGIKAFGWYYPWINTSLADEDVRVLNNYTFQLLFQHWAPIELWLVLTSAPATPYWVWKPIVDELKTVNATYAQKVLSQNITKFAPPYWGLSPYYVSQVTTAPSVVFKLEPPNVLKQWYSIFPINSFQYYPEIDVMWTPSYATSYAILLGHQVDWIWAALTTKQMQVLNATGKIDIGTPYYDMCNSKGMWLNPNVYPWNYPQARRAIVYVLNRTAIPLVYEPSYFPTTHNLWDDSAIQWLTFPDSIKNIVIDFPINWTHARELLESVGLVYKNGQWYYPNGTPLTLTIIVPNSLTDMVEEATLAAEELTEFGIPTKVLAVDPSYFFGTVMPEGQYVAAYGFFDSVPGYLTASLTYLDYPWGYWSWGAVYNLSKPYPFAWPNVTNHHLVGWYCKPYNAPASMNLPNSTIIWCVNSTFGYINLTNWTWMMQAAVPGSPEYEEAVLIYTAWWEYFAPGIEGTAVDWVPFGGAHWRTDLDFDWAYYSMPLALAQAVPSSPYTTYCCSPTPAIFFGFGAPEGVIPPMAQAILNGSLWTKYYNIAYWLGLTDEDLPKYGPAMITVPITIGGVQTYNGSVVVPVFTSITQVQEAVAKYFHTTYTPVTITPVTTTSTTTTTTTTTTTAVSTVTSTATVTSTVTSTSVSTTTAVSTVTVTKPVISTALVIGIVVIVIVVAAVAAVIALRRR